MRIPGIPFIQARNAYRDEDGRKYAIAIHCTANNATAEQEAAYASRRTDGVSAHFFVDRDSVVQSLDTDDRAGHAGSHEGNEHAIAVEITGFTSWTRTQWLSRVAWDQLARVLAILCRHYDIAVRRATIAEMRANPRVRAFYGHDDMRRAWGGTTHTDPGPNFPWDHLLATVKQALKGEEMQLNDPIRLVTGKDVDYSSPTTTVEGVLASTNYYVLQSRNKVLAELAEAKTREEAILAAISGASRDQVLATIREQGERTRAELATRAGEDAARDAELAKLIRAGLSGRLVADEALRRIGELLAVTDRG